MAGATYRERVRWPAWVHLLVLLCAGVAFASGAGLVRRGDFHPSYLIAFAAAALVAGIWWKMRHLDLEFGPDGAGFGFGGLVRRVEASRIRGAWPEDYRLSRYMGWGWRIGAQPGDRAYSVLGYPRGVRLEYTDPRGRPYSVFLSCRDPESACAALPESVRKSSAQDLDGAK